MPGYKLLESDQSAVDAEYLCLCCGLLLRDPMQIGCGHLCCESCIDDLQLANSGQLQCRACEKTLNRDQVFLDNFLKREILSYKIQCSQEGCDWKGELRERDRHLSSMCNFVELPCPNQSCGMMVKRPDLARHLELECPCRLVKCSYCQANTEANQREDHTRTCRQFPVECPDCHQLMERFKMAKHIDPVQGDCQEVEIECPFKSIGCQAMNSEKAKRVDMEKHLEESGVVHFYQLFVALQMFIGQVEQTFGSSRRTNNEQDNDLLARLCSIVRVIHSSVVGRTEENYRELRQQQLELERTFNHMLRSIPEASRSDLPEDIFSQQNCHRPLNINDLAKRCQQALTSYHKLNSSYQQLCRGVAARVEQVDRRFESLENNQLDIQRRLRLVERRAEPQDRDNENAITSVERRTASLPNNSSEGASTSRSLSSNPATALEADFLRRLVNLENKIADHDVLLDENERNVEDARHQNSYLQRHLELAQETIRRLEGRGESQDQDSENLRQQISDLQRQLELAQETIRRLEGRGESQDQDNQNLRQQISDLQRQLELAQETIRRLEGRGESHDQDNQNLRQQINDHQPLLELAQETIRRLERRVESQDHMIALRNVALADLEEYIRQQEVSSYNGVLLWKITDFTRRRNDAQGGRQTSFYSPSFYTSRRGYKMCARIYLNGDGMGKGTHISLFFVVMRGQYDALLRWPFRQKVTLIILDQDNLGHVFDAFRPDPNSSSFQKPQREMNIASGCPVLFPLTDLEKHAYVRDDTMFVKIIVDTSDL